MRVREHTNSISRRTHGARDEYHNIICACVYLFIGKFSPRPAYTSASRSPRRITDVALTAYRTR